MPHCCLAPDMLYKLPNPDQAPPGYCMTACCRMTQAVWRQGWRQLIMSACFSMSEIMLCCL